MRCAGSAPRSGAATLRGSIQPLGKERLMSVLDPRELEASPLADLHALAAELGLEGFRRLRKQDLINQIVAAQGGEVRSSDDDEPEVALYEDASAEPEAADDFSPAGAVEDDQEDL